jgi:protein PhnA
MSALPRRPQCSSELTYEDGPLYVCPECAHEWARDGGSTAIAAEVGVLVRDANGNELKDGDTVTVIKDLKVKGSSTVLKVGTKVKAIRLVEGDHNIDCRYRRHRRNEGQVGVREESAVARVDSPKAASRLASRSVLPFLRT